MVRELIPEGAVSALSPQNLSDERHTPGLDGAWLNAQTEVSSDFSDGTVLKAAIMGEIIRVNPKGKDAYDLMIEALFLFAGNALPRFKGDLKSIMDRWLPIKFERRVRDTKEDIKDIGKTIAQTEMAGLIEWAMFCGRRLMEERQYTIPPSSQAIFADWREDSDPVQTWLTYEVQSLSESLDKRDWTSLTDVYESFADWAKSAGYKPITRRTLSKRIKDAGKRVERITEGRVVNIKVTRPEKKNYPY
jgi:phage/plasmid-associated DNA primase